MNEFYVIAQNTDEPVFPNSPDWPKIIGYCYEENTFLFIEGNGYGFNGAVLKESVAREARWVGLFTELDAHWFLNLIGNTKFPSKDAFINQIKTKLATVEIIKS